MAKAAEAVNAMDANGQAVEADAANAVEADGQVVEADAANAVDAVQRVTVSGLDIVSDWIQVHHWPRRVAYIERQHIENGWAGAGTVIMWERAAFRSTVHKIGCVASGRAPEEEVGAQVGAEVAVGVEVAADAVGANATEAQAEKVVVDAPGAVDAPERPAPSAPAEAENPTTRQLDISGLRVEPGKCGRPTRDGRPCRWDLPCPNHTGLETTDMGREDVVSARLSYGICGVVTRNGNTCHNIRGRCVYHALPEVRCKSCRDENHEVVCRVQRQTGSDFCHFHQPFPNLGLAVWKYVARRPSKLDADAFMSEFYPDSITMVPKLDKLFSDSMKRFVALEAEKMEVKVEPATKRRRVDEWVADAQVETNTEDGPSSTDEESLAGKAVDKEAEDGAGKAVDKEAEDGAGKAVEEGQVEVDDQAAKRRRVQAEKTTELQGILLEVHNDVVALHVAVGTYVWVCGDDILACRELPDDHPNDKIRQRAYYDLIRSHGIPGGRFCDEANLANTTCRLGYKYAVTFQGIYVQR